jgi:hypothetical protein
MNIRKNKMARDPEHYLNRGDEIFILERTGDVMFGGSWIAIDEAGTASFVRKTRFEHGYLRHIHFVVVLEIVLPHYEERFVNDWLRSNRPEFIYPAMEHLGNHEGFVGEAIECHFLDDRERREFEAWRAEAAERTGRVSPIDYLERVTQQELLRALGKTRLEDLIPPAEPQVESTVARGEIEVSRCGVINVGPFERDLKDTPEGVGPEYRLGVEWRDEFLEILETILEEMES